MRDERVVVVFRGAWLNRINAFDDPSSQVTVPVPEYEMSARP